MVSKKKKKQTTKRALLEKRKLSQVERKVNPFEVHVNKVKHKVLGRRVTKSEHGKPYESRNKAFKKRKQSLFKEYKDKDKTGALMDNRIDESKGGVEARKAKIWRNRDNVTQETEHLLTHRGADVLNAPKNDALVDSDEEIDLLGRSEYVETAHFGGGQDGAARSAKEFLEQMKREKHLKQMEKEYTIELTEKLDDNMSSVRGLLPHKRHREEEEMDMKNSDKSYDKSIRELMFMAAESRPLNLDSEPFKRQEKRIAEPELNFLQQIKSIVECEDDNYIRMLKEIMSSDFKDGKGKGVMYLQQLIQEINLNNFDEKKLTLLTLGASIPQMTPLVRLQLIEILRTVKFKSIMEVSKLFSIMSFLFEISENLYIPEIVLSLQNVLSLFLLDDDKISKFFIPLNKIAKNRHITRIDMNDSNLNQVIDFNLKLKFNDIDEIPMQTAKLVIFSHVIDFLHQVVDKYSNYNSFLEIFESIKSILSIISTTPGPLSIKIEKILALFSNNHSKTALSRGRSKPVILPMFEPNFGFRSNNKNMRKILEKKVKRETRGAQRELRKDSQFMKDTWLKETLAKDRIRKKKVNELMNDLALQQNQFKKKRKR